MTKSDSSTRLLVSKHTHLAPLGGADLRFAPLPRRTWAGGVQGWGVTRGEDYDRRFAELAAQGQHLHGEADLVEAYRPVSLLDAGCGTGRVALELQARGHAVTGVDLDPDMLAAARAKAPHLEWVEGDLADPDLLPGREFDTVVMAGNVLLFVRPGT